MIFFSYVLRSQPYLLFITDLHMCASRAIPATERVCVCVSLFFALTFSRYLAKSSRAQAFTHANTVAFDVRDIKVFGDFCHR